MASFARQLINQAERKMKTKTTNSWAGYCSLAGGSLSVWETVTVATHRPQNPAPPPCAPSPRADGILSDPWFGTAFRSVRSPPVILLLLVLSCRLWIGADPGFAKCRACLGTFRVDESYLYYLPNLGSGLGLHNQGPTPSKTAIVRNILPVRTWPGPVDIAVPPRRLRSLRWLRWPCGEYL